MNAIKKENNFELTKAFFKIAEDFGYFVFIFFNDTFATTKGLKSME